MWKKRVSGSLAAAVKFAAEASISGPVHVARQLGYASDMYRAGNGAAAAAHARNAAETFLFGSTRALYRRLRNAGKPRGSVKYPAMRGVTSGAAYVVSVRAKKYIGIPFISPRVSDELLSQWTINGQPIVIRHLPDPFFNNLFVLELPDVVQELRSAFERDLKRPVPYHAVQELMAFNLNPKAVPYLKPFDETAYENKRRMANRKVANIAEFKYFTKADMKNVAFVEKKYRKLAIKLHPNKRADKNDTEFKRLTDERNAARFIASRTR